MQQGSFYYEESAPLVRKIILWWLRAKMGISKKDAKNFKLPERYRRTNAEGFWGNL